MTQFSDSSKTTRSADTPFEDIMEYHDARPKQLTVPLLCGLFWDHRSRLFRTAKIMLCDPQKAEDAVSETLIRAVNKLESYDCQQGTVGQWLYGLCKKVCLEHRRADERRNREVSLDDVEKKEKMKKGGKKNGR